MEGSIKQVLDLPVVDAAPPGEAINRGLLADASRAWETWRAGAGDWPRWDSIVGAVVVAGVVFGSLAGIVAPTTDAITPGNSKALYLLACLCVPVGFLLVARAEARCLATIGGEDARSRLLGTLLVVAVVCAGSVAWVPTRARETFWVGALVCAVAVVPRDALPRVIVSPFAVALAIAALYVAYLGSATVAPMALAVAIFVPACAIFVWALFENVLPRMQLAPNRWRLAVGLVIGAFGWFSLVPYGRGAVEVGVLAWYVAVTAFMLATDAPRSPDLRLRVAAYASLAIGVLLEHAGAYPATIFPVGVALACLYFLIEVVYHRRLSSEAFRQSWLHYTVTIIAILCCFNTLLLWDPYHYSFFLFPARDLIAGKSLLVDINAQYGIGVVYLTALICGWSITSVTGPFLSGALNILNIIQYLGLYYFTCVLVRSRRVALMLWIAVLFNRSWQLGSAESFPSTGPLRFGLGYLAIFVVTSAWFARRSVWRLAVEATLFGVAVIFSVEGLASVAVIQVGSDVASLLSVRGDLRSRVVHASIHRANAWISGSIIFIGLLTMDVARRAGALPDWHHYTDFIFRYGGGFGFYQPELGSPWAAVFLLSAGGALVAASRLARADDATEADIRRLSCGLLIGVFGTLQFSYFVFRPHPNNLLHVMWPATIMVLWLLDHIVAGRMTMSAPVRAAVASTVLVTASVLASRTIMSARPWLAGSGIDRIVQLARDGGNGAWFNYAGQMRLDVDGTQVRGYLTKYATGVNRFPMLLHDEIWQRAIAGTPYVNTFAMSFEPQDSLIPLGMTMAVNSARGLPFGSILLVEHDLSRLRPVHGAVIRTLCDRGGLETIERGNHVDVMRLIPTHDIGTNTICGDVGRMKAFRE